MLEILEFIFSSFWVWLGTLILLIFAGVGINFAMLGLRGKDIK